MKKSKEAFGISPLLSWRGTKAGRTRRRNRYIDGNQPSGYDRWAAVHNLKQMAATVAAYEQYGFTSPEQLDAAITAAYADLHDSSAELKTLEAALQGKLVRQKSF